MYFVSLFTLLYKFYTSQVVFAGFLLLKPLPVQRRSPSFGKRLHFFSDPWEAHSLDDLEVGDLISELLRQGDPGTRR